MDKSTDDLPAFTDAMSMLAKISTATLTTQLLKMKIPSTFIEGVYPLNPDRSQFVGEAYTLRLIPMREDLMKADVVKDAEYPQRKCIESCPAGHVLVVSARGVTEAGVYGDILMTRLMVRGVAAVVCDGAMRDVKAMSQMEIPVFCSGGAAPSNLNAHFAPDLQVPVACGGVSVFPGDVLVGDSDGVVVLPRVLVPQLARDGARQERLEAFIQKKVAAGATTVGTYPPDAQTMAEYARWEGR